MYENKGNKKQTFTQTSLFLDFDEKEEEKEDFLTEKLESINPLEITPMEALNLLYEWKKELKEKK